MQYELVAGLETHVQLRTRTKLFCGCSTAFGAPPNTQTCPVCLGLPGSLPVLNRQAFELALKAALALGAEIQSFTRFDRKNYFYPDLPKGYQISQYDKPFSLGGGVTIGDGGSERTIRLVRIHLEEDAGKLIHSPTADRSEVDLNRCGVPLIEIVSQPDVRTAQEAYEYLTELKSILRYAGVSDCDMEKGELRCDVNVSLRPRGAAAMGVRAEIKNLNSFRFVARAIEAEERRQKGLLESGRRVVQETLLYDPERDRTEPMRSKEEAHDYRYFPEPDLRPLHVSAPWVERIRATLPELPRARRLRFERALGLSAYDAGVLAGDAALADFFEAVPFADRKVAANWVTNDLMRRLNDRGETLGQAKITPKDLGSLLGLIADRTITGASGKIVLEQMLATGKDPATIVREKGLGAAGDAGELERAVAEVVAEHPKAAADYRGGKQTALKFMLGQVMKKMKGRADPAAAAQALERALQAP
jgi:aspartyl-tRNA(Asn)/glutamyl-tRNA(Gln) amidotransferase subunit B